MVRPAKNPLIITQFNLENLFLFLNHYNNEDFEKIDENQWQKLSSANVSNKPLKKLWAIKRIIDDVSPDVMLLSEVGGAESLNNFNHYFLKNQYEVHLIEGNSDRGIDVGFLLKKDLGYKPVLLTHKERPLDFNYAHEKENSKKYYFSRDVAELRLFSPNSSSPDLVFLATHLKSKLDPQGLDPKGRGRRASELRALVEIYNEIKEELGPNANIVVGGDFNGIASPQNTENEFSELYSKTDLLELFELKDLPMEERYTQIQLLPGRPRQNLQIDYLFISPSLKDYVQETYVYRFKDEWGEVLPAPTNLDQRFQLPSDHYPVVLKLQGEEE